MFASPRRFAALSCYLLWFCQSPLLAEDVKLREEAVRLMERANQVSLPGAVPNYEHTVTFTVHYPDGTTRTGSYSRVSKGAAGYRDEVSFGDFHAIAVRLGDRSSATAGDTPPEYRELREQLPVHLGSFDHEDVIRSIEETHVQGRPAKCVLFSTHFGNTMQQNQVCMDAVTGVMLHWQVGDETIENSDYTKVGSLWEPAHISRSVRGALRMEIEQQVSVIEGNVDPNLFTPPTAHWNKLFQCRTSRRPIGISTPQPAPGNLGTETVDIVVWGLIRQTGNTEALKIFSSSRPELNDEALRIVSK